MKRNPGLRLSIALSLGFLILCASSYRLDAEKLAVAITNVTLVPLAECARRL